MAETVISHESEDGKKQDEPAKIYVDGGFDLVHSGHYNAIRQAKALGDYLVVGVNSDADILKTKGPTILNVRERAEILRHCKFVDEVAPDMEYTPTMEILKRVGCNFYAHGDDPCFDSEGTDVTKIFRDAGMYKEFKRTPGVSTTSITSKLLALAQNNPEENEYKESKEPPKQVFLATSRRIINFANKNLPKQTDTIVYI